jgi:hypothetical protein
MNFPRPELAQRSFDLQFTPEKNPDATTIDAARQWMEMPPGTEAAVTLTSFDWGGWATLQITAVVDGSIATGFLKGDRGATDILIPKREETSKIAERWLSDVGIGGYPDDSDGDDEPEGDGHEGDGFSLYEEYRGFIHKGAHLELDPNVKDLFVRDTIGGRSKWGISQFTAASKLAVHHELESSEYPPSRVMNANTSGWAHRVDQHCLVLIRGSQEFISAAEGGPGLPRAISHVEISMTVQRSPIDLVTIRSGGTTTHSDRLSFIYAHELGHAVNIWHHGDTDIYITDWRIQRDNSGRIVRDDALLPVVVEGGGLQVEVFREPNVRFVPRSLEQSVGPLENYVGVRGGQHSGEERCFMRYDVANVYATDAYTRFWIMEWRSRSEAAPQDHFCASSLGTGFNDSSRDPHSRFGDASSTATDGPAKRGDCLHRICVNDILGDH